MTDPRPPSRINTTALFASILVAVVAGGVVVDRVAPARLRPVDRVGAITPGGVWTCPVVSMGKGGGTLNLANGAVEPSTVRVRWQRPPLRPVELGVTVPGGRSLSLTAPRSGETQVGAVVEWAGGELIASRTAQQTLAPGRSAAIGATCGRAGEPVLAATGFGTLGSESTLVILNPSSADALVDISILLAGEEIQPESLRRRAIAPRGRLAVRLGDFVFDKPALGAIVRTMTGAVVADVLSVSARAASLIPATPPLREGIVAGVALGASRLSMVAIGEDPATIDASTLRSDDRGTTRGFPPGLDPFAPVSLTIPGPGAFAVSLSGREGSPFVAALGWGLPVRGGSDAAGIPVGTVSSRWLAVAGPPSTGSSVRIVVSNPSDEPVRVRARLLTQTGLQAPSTLTNLTLAAGRVISFVLGVPHATVGVEIVSEGGSVGFALVGSSGAGAATLLYGMAGVPAAARGRPGVELDARAGVSAAS